MNLMMMLLIDAIIWFNNLLKNHDEWINTLIKSFMSPKREIEARKRFYIAVFS